MRCKWIVVALVGLGGLVVGCNQSLCTRSTDCQGTLVCSDVGTCVVPPDLAGIKSDVDGGDGGVDGGATEDLAVAASSTEDLATTD
jgi:hypothetical protein